MSAARIVRMNEPLGQPRRSARRALTTRFQVRRASNSAELDARMLVGAVLGLDLTGMIAAASRLSHRG